MGTALATTTEPMDAPAGVAPIVHTIPGTALTFGDTARLAKTLHASGLLGNKIRSAEQAFAIIVAGAELGLPPMLALRSVALIDGKPIVAADVQLGAFKRAGGRATFRELSDTRAVLWLRHPNGDEHVESFTMDDAKAAGLAGKDNWRKFPKSMLRSRAITAGLKSVGFEPTAGMYDPDEAQHFASAAAAPATEGETLASARSGDAPTADTAADALDYAICPAGPHAGAKWRDTEAFDLRDLVTMHDYFERKVSDAADPDDMQGYVEALSAEIDHRRDLGRASVATRGNAMDADQIPEPPKARRGKAAATDTETEALPL